MMASSILLNNKATALYSICPINNYFCATIMDKSKYMFELQFVGYCRRLHNVGVYEYYNSGKTANISKNW